MKPSRVFLLVFSVTLSFCLVNTQPVEPQSSGTIYIRADGTIEGTDKIQREGNVYTFMDNIFNQSIVVECSNIVVDGRGYTLQGTGAENSIGMNLLEVRFVTIRNLRIDDFYRGLRLHHSSNNIVTGNTITNNNGHGILLGSDSYHNIVSGNNITANGYYGIDVADDYNIITGNYIADNDRYGINIYTSEYNEVSENNITNNGFGITLWGSKNAFRNNIMNNNTYNFGVQGGGINNVDTSNTVDGKPIYYWTNEQDSVVPSDAGYVALISCTNITVQNLNLTNNEEGIFLSSTTNSTITRNNITDNRYGIRFQQSSKNTITRNYIANGYFGIRLEGSSSNTIFGNYITSGKKGSSSEGVWVNKSSNNTITGNYITKNGNGITIQMFLTAKNIVSGNTISDNRDGLRIIDSSNQIIYHNNFINNTRQAVYVPFLNALPRRNFWDDGYPSGGNFWSNYNGSDMDLDGIGDVSYFIFEENQDRYPLMSRWGSPITYIFSPVSRMYAVNTVSLTFVTSEPTSWIGYSLDGQANVTIDGNATLTELSERMHTLIVFANDTAGNIWSSDTIRFVIDFPPDILIFSPENKTYHTINIPLSFTVTEPVSWTSYSLDGRSNVTIAGNTTFGGLSYGSHSLTIYAEDSGGNTGASETVYFTIAQETESTELFPTWVVAVIVIIAIVGVATLVYFGRRKTTEVKEVPEGVM